jgi:hypothetical protein
VPVSSLNDRAHFLKISIPADVLKAVALRQRTSAR